MTSSGPIRVEAITTPEGLLSLRGDWERLLERCPYRNLFLTHRWYSTWWKHFGKDRRLQILKFTRGDRVVGLAPLTLQRTRLRWLPVRQLALPVNGCSLQSDVIFPEEQDEMFRAFVDYLEGSARAWDVVFLDGMSTTSGNLESLRRALEGRSLTLASPVTWDCLVLPLRGDWEAFRQALPRNLRKNLRVCEQRLQSLGEVTYRRFDRPEEMDRAFEVLLHLEERSWKYQQGQAMARTPGYVDFFRECAAQLSPEGNFQVRVVELNGEAISGNFVMVHDGTVYGMKNWHDQRYAEASPGRVAFHYLVRDVWGRGVREIFLDRKTFFYGQWTRQTRSYHTLRLFNRRLYSAAIGWLRRGFLRARAGPAAAPDAAAPE